MLSDQFQTFVKEFNQFHSRIDDMDRRLGSIVYQAFDDCTGTETTFKLLHMFGSLLDR